VNDGVCYTQYTILLFTILTAEIVTVTILAVWRDKVIKSSTASVFLWIQFHRAMRTMLSLDICLSICLLHSGSVSIR